MATTLEAVLLSSTGLALTYEGATLLVDVLNGKFGSFYEIPAQTAEHVVTGEPPFDHVVGLLYSHLHPDHYDPQKNTEFLQRHPSVPTFFPTAETPDCGVLNWGPFTVHYGYLEHMPCNYTWAKHYVFWITAGEITVYLTTDGRLVPQEHLAFLNGRQADYAFFNAVYLSYPETRQLMAQAARKTYIYHMPEPASDQSGICRKAERNLQRYPEELRNVTVLEQYPTRMIWQK